MAGYSYQHHCLGESMKPQHVQPAEVSMHALVRPGGVHESRQDPQRDLLYGELTHGKRPKGILQLRYSDICIPGH